MPLSYSFPEMGKSLRSVFVLISAGVFVLIAAINLTIDTAMSKLVKIVKRNLITLQLNLIKFK